MRGNPSPRGTSPQRRRRPRLLADPQSGLLCTSLSGVSAAPGHGNSLCRHDCTGCWSGEGKKWGPLTGCCVSAPNATETTATEEEERGIRSCSVTNLWCGAGAGRAAPCGQSPAPYRSRSRSRASHAWSEEEEEGRGEAVAQWGSAHFRSLSFALVHLIGPGRTAGATWE